MEKIEGQIGLGKHQQNFDIPQLLVTVDEQRSMKEGEENRDPNPEKNNGEMSKDEIVPSPNMNHDNVDMNNSDVQKEEEIDVQEKEVEEDEDEENNG